MAPCGGPRACRCNSISPQHFGLVLSCPQQEQLAVAQMGPNRFIEELQKTSNSNVFVMMRYRSAVQFQQIEDAIRRASSEFGLTALFAKDRALVEDLWENIQIYMRFSRYGVAVFEEIDEREFNPNISLELGYMYAHNRRCLLLKDRRMPLMPTDWL